MDEPFGALDPVTRDQFGQPPIRKLHDRSRADHDHGHARHGRSVVARRPRAGDEQAGKIVADAEATRHLIGGRAAVTRPVRWSRCPANRRGGCANWRATRMSGPLPGRRLGAGARICWRQHVLLAASALLLGIGDQPAAGGVVGAQRPTVARVTLGFASLVQTIPSLALPRACSILCCSRFRLWSVAASPRSASCRRCSRSGLYALLPILTERASPG